MTGRRDPSLVRVEEAVIVVTTDCCRNEMPLARGRVGLDQPHRLCCFWCGRRRRLELVADPVAGLRAVWSDPPGERRRRRRWRWGR
ncbi:MAG: hypothetical protein ACRDZ4_11205 [Egibacteraceae bacterium]